MQQTPIRAPNIDVNRQTIARVLVISFLVLVAFLALMFSRRVIQPMDNILTQQQCTTHGREVLSRQTVDSEASNRFSLINRSRGSCEFGPVVEFDEDGEVVELPPAEIEAGSATDLNGDPIDPELIEEPAETVEVSLADIETSGFYRGMKWLFIALQLGAASAAVRLVGEPLLDRFVRQPASPDR